MTSFATNGGSAALGIDIEPSSVRLLQPQTNGGAVTVTPNGNGKLTYEDEPEISGREVTTKVTVVKPWRYAFTGFVIGVTVMSIVLVVYILVVGNSGGEDGKLVQEVQELGNGMDGSAKRIGNFDTSENKTKVSDIPVINSTIRSENIPKAVDNANSEVKSERKISSDKTDDAFCITKGCIETAIDIRRSMNMSVNPCDNFFEFACGRYIPELNGASTPHEELQLKYNRIIEEKLNMTSSPGDHRIIKYARTVYRNCLTAGKDIDTRMIRTFIQKTMDIPKWPSPLMSRLRKNYISEITAELILQFSLAPLFDVDSLLPSVQERSLLQISSDPSFNLLPFGLRHGRQNTSFIVFDSYAKYMSAVMKEFGGQSPKSTDYQIRQMAEEVVRFEQDLFEVTSRHTNKTAFDILTVQEIDQLGPDSQSEKISPRQTIDHILTKAGRPPLVDEDKVHIFNSSVLAELINLISTTRQEIVVNYLGYRLALQFVPLSNYLTILHIINPYTLGGPGLPLGNRDKCMQFAKQVFLPALSRYPNEAEVKNGDDTSIFREDVVRNIRGMYLNIRDELILNIPKNTELIESRRTSSVEEIKKIRTCQDTWILNTTELEKYYSGVTFKFSYLDQMSSLWGWKNAQTFNIHGQFLTDICDTVALSPAFVPSVLQMNIPPTLWMEPFYNQEWPEYLKYSGVADIIGHEMMHALFYVIPEWVDNPNSNQDPNEMKTNRKMSLEVLDIKDVFSQSAERHSSVPFPSRFSLPRGSPTFRSSQCIIDHYEGFTPNPKRYESDLLSFLRSDDHNTSAPQINGTKTFEENFSDVGGIQLAFSAYKSSLERNRGQIIEKKLPGLTDYSNDQVFFINFARKWCDIHSPLLRSALLQFDEHSPQEFRVLGTLRNSPEFARAWNCPEGSFMNPTDKCPIF